ncbi:MAG: glycosyltransferase family 4 protein [Pseudomonadota bacterium]
MAVDAGETRVLALATEAFGGRGGIAQSTRDLLTALAALPGVAEIKILPRLRHEPVARLPERIDQGQPKSSRLAYAAGALALALKWRPQIIYCGHAFMAPLAQSIAQAVRARFICHVHGLEVWEPLSGLKRRALAAADLILCVSHYTADKVTEITGAQPERCKVVYNTVSARFVPGDKKAARARLGIAADAVLLSTVSRLDARQRHKGHDRVIPLLPELAKENPSLIYFVAGTGDDRARLEALAHETGAADIVRFGGFISDDDLPDLYRASDLYVMPSHGEGFGIAFVEAMACGTPAIGLDIGGAPDALRDGELGRAVNESALAGAISAALREQDPLAAASLAQKTRATFGAPAFTARLKGAVLPLLAR